MKRLYDFLNIAIWSSAGVFLGSSIYTLWDYRARSGLYAMRSAPWYLGIGLRAVFLAAIVAALLLARRLIRRQMERK